ncbi:MAG TPA: hypothetical protein VD996_00550, partial [Chitinophagaceae bacterium]|nr:hypothetical protein [Chitinophagaceae bacterium]
MERNYELLKSTEERNNAGRAAELNGDTDEAIRIYEENIKQGYPDPHAFNRLMILYRKQKRYKDELRVIKRGIKVFSEDYDKHRKKLLSSAGNKRQVQQLSEALMKKSG